MYAIRGAIQIDENSAVAIKRGTGELLSALLQANSISVADIISVLFTATVALAGIPLTSGFIAKFGVFSAAYESGSTWLVVVGVLSSAVAAYFYIRLIVIMFFEDADSQGPTVAAAPIKTTIVIAVCAVITLVVGVIPNPIVKLISQSARLVF